MLVSTNIKYSYNDVAVIPAHVSLIEHRSECNPFITPNKLPIFTAPMSSVVGEGNFNLFEENHINAILPRNVDIKKRIEYTQQGKWVAFSLNEFIDLFTNENNVQQFINDNVKHVLIDVANGHMKKIYDNTSKAKAIFGDMIEIMVGNMANPSSYALAVENGVSYVRVSIGSGLGCITSSNTAIHFPNASLIAETYSVKKFISERDNIDMVKMPKIIADGGIRNYSDVIKALALGADYVMIGGVFSSLVESCGLTFHKDNEGNQILINDWDICNIVEIKGKFHDKQNNIIYDNLYKQFYGMASDLGQKILNGEKTKTAEGVVKNINVTTNLSKWVDNMISYLKSAMSYTNTKEIKDLNKASVILISNHTYNSVNK